MITTAWNMRRRHLLAGSALAPLAGWCGPAASAPASRRIALVIGNARYAQLPLANPENDARLIAGTMASLGFEVQSHFDLTAREFKRVLRDFGRRLDDDDAAAVFYYAGHGLQIDGRNYLVPVDLNLRDEGEIRDEAIDLQDTLLARIDRVRPRARIFIIDACRDNPFAPRTRSVRGGAAGLAEMAAPGALIAFSAAPGRTAEDGPPGTHSVYSRTLAQEMRVQGIEVEEMLKNVRIKVLRETQERQIPWVNTSMVVNFVFNPGGAPALAEAPALPPGAAAGPGAASVALRGLALRLRAGQALNSDRQQVSATLALRVYLLRDRQNFDRTGFDSLYDSDETTLGTTMLHREVVHLRPGEEREVVLPLAQGAKYVAVLAAFREIERAQWRSVLALPPDEAPPPVRLDAQAHQVQLVWAR